MGKRTMDIIDKAIQGLVENEPIQVVPMGVFGGLFKLLFDFLSSYFVGIIHQDVFAGGATRGDEVDFCFESGPENFVNPIEDFPHSRGIAVKSRDSGFEVGVEVGSDGLVHNSVSCI